MTQPYQPYAVMAKFACLGADCPDTCCRGWDMPADKAQLARYEARAPELLAIIDLDANILRREPTGQHCAQLCEGICSVHQKYGTELLGDACYFYPRLLHNVGGSMVMSGAASCPEMLRLIMHEAAPFARHTAMTERLPAHRRDIVPTGWSADSVEAVIDAALASAADETQTPEASMHQLLALAQAMEKCTPENWRARWQQAMEDAPASESKEGDSHTLYYALALTEAFGPPGVSQKLHGIMQTMEQALGCHFTRETRELQFLEGSKGVQARLWQRWNIDARTAHAPMLRRWIQAQITLTMFPFAGFRAIDFAARGAVLVQRFTTMRLALMCHVPMNGAALDEQTVLDVMQGLARFMDHLADADLTMMIHRDAGWQTPSRLYGLIG
ncbi:MAG: flagellin lysine-N-methylase [Rickettsiales bacterium]|nr:flagellin lysine-N-methylase [Rickettsiales bacterium]